jgi:hypothetical protein
MKSSDFLDWLADRLVSVYDESPNVDFVQRLRREARDARRREQGEKTNRKRKREHA